MNQQLMEYIEQNRVCSEWIFPNWREFIELLFRFGYRVQSIVWYEYTETHKQKESLGGGGYRDLENPDYMWAETMLFDDDLTDKSLSELTEHIQSIIDKSQPHRLVPCFLGLE